MGDGTLIVDAAVRRATTLRAWPRAPLDQQAA
jgi:hypothetical protein